jgi:small-conductance mechanosensitive channel
LLIFSIFLIIIASLGINITSFIAGIGIGGIAIAFALQNILEELFSSFSIYLDKPFKKGDFIKIGDDIGEVIDIGIKSTRIKTLNGQELIVPNKEITRTRINNFKRMEERRGVFTLLVEYSTPAKKLKTIPQKIIKIISKEKDARVDRVHFKEFGDSGLVFEIVFYVKTNNYKLFMDIQERINLQIKELFDKEKIKFAFPSRTLYKGK